MQALFINGCDTGEPVSPHEANKNQAWSYHWLPQKRVHKVETYPDTSKDERHPEPDFAGDGQLSLRLQIVAERNTEENDRYGYKDDSQGWWAVHNYSQIMICVLLYYEWISCPAKYHSPSRKRLSFVLIHSAYFAMACFCCDTSISVSKEKSIP